MRNLIINILILLIFSSSVAFAKSSSRQILVITNKELQEFNHFQPRPVPSEKLRDIFVRVKLFALAAVNEGVVKTSPANMEELIKAAKLYGNHVCYSWTPSEEAIYSYYLAHERKFTSCNVVLPLEEARPKIIEILQKAACKKLLHEKEKTLRQKVQLVFKDH